MAIDKLSMNNLHIENVPDALQPEDPPNEKPIDPKQPDLTGIPDPTKTKTHRQVVGVENAGGKTYCKATRMYNKHRKYSEQWISWHPFRSTNDFHQAQLFSQQTKIWIYQHLRCGLNNFKIKFFQFADAMRKLVSKLDFRLGDDCWIDYNSHIFRTLYYRDIFKCSQLLLAHVPFQPHLDFEPVCLANFEGRQNCSEMITGDWW
jgi:hypothetical protein